jgi:hypothetical protein
MTSNGLPANLPAASDMVLNADDDLVWMQCRRCHETWQVVTMADALTNWYAHRCRGGHPV